MKHKQLLIILAITAVALILSACGSAIASTPADADTTIPEITIKATDHAFEVPAQIEAGLVKLTMINDGQEPHMAQLLRLNDGVSMEQFQTALQEDIRAIFGMVTTAGGPGVIDPGLRTQVTLNLTPGQYVLLCFISSDDDVPHLAKGMIQPIEVVAHTGHDHAASPPKADVVAKLVDFSFILPAEIKSGPQVWQVVNEGAQPHELLVMKLAEGKNVEDVWAYEESGQGPQPYTSIGGFQAINADESGWLHLDLEPGNYVAYCFVPDPASGHAHAELGMVVPFTVK